MKDPLTTNLNRRPRECARRILGGGELVSAPISLEGLFSPPSPQAVSAVGCTDKQSRCEMCTGSRDARVSLNENGGSMRGQSVGKRGSPMLRRIPSATGTNKKLHQTPASRRTLRPSAMLAIKRCLAGESETRTQRARIDHSPSPLRDKWIKSILALGRSQTGRNAGRKRSQKTSSGLAAKEQA